MDLRFRFLLTRSTVRRNNPAVTMNKSFRTAFWAMCLGLTVPMVLFIGVELTPGGRAARKSILAANEYRGSLRGYWSQAQAKLAASESAGQIPRGTNGSNPPPPPGPPPAGEGELEAI